MVFLETRKQTNHNHDLDVRKKKNPHSFPPFNNNNKIATDKADQENRIRV